MSDLLSEYRNSGLTVYMDDYYSSPQLFAVLYDQNINVVGTVRSSRKGFPAAQLFTKASISNRGENKYVANGPLLACSWWTSLFMVDKLVHGWTSLFVGGQACSWVDKLVHGWTSLFVGGQACSWVDRLVHGWTSLFMGGQAC